MDPIFLLKLILSSVSLNTVIVVFERTLILQNLNHYKSVSLVGFFLGFRSTGPVNFFQDTW